MSMFSPNVSSAAGRSLARFGLLLLAVLCLGGGGMATYFLGVQPLWDALRSRDWQPVTVSIQEVQLGGGPGGGNRGAKVAVLYRYKVGNQVYEGSRFGVHAWMDNAEAQRAAYADLLYRHRAQAWFNPRDPSEALLDRELHWTVLGMALPALGALVLGGLILWAAIVGGLANWRASRRLKRVGVR